MGKEDKENMIDEQSMREHWLSDLAPLSDAAQQLFSGKEVPMSEEETADLLDEAEFRFPKNKPISQSEDALIQEALVLGGPVGADQDPDAPQLSEEKMQILLGEVTRQLGAPSVESVPDKSRKLIPFKPILSTLGIAAAVMLGFFIFKGDPSVDPGAVAQGQIDTMPQGGAIVLAFNGEALVSEMEGDEKSDFRTLEDGDLLAPGTELKTGAESEAVLLLTNGSLATLGPDSQMRLAEFTQKAFEGTEEKVSELTDEPSESHVLLELDLGELVVEVKKLDKQSSFDLYSHLGFAGIRGTQYRALATDRSVRLSVLEGKVAVSKERGGLDHLIESERAILLEEDLQKEPDGATVEEIERIKRVNERARKLAEKIKLKDLAEAYDEINKRLALALKEKELEHAMNKAIDEGTYIVESAANMEMIWCKPGTFMMGNPADKNRPQQKVTLSDGFFLGKYEVTQEEYEKVMGNNPSQIKGNKFAVSSIRGWKYDISKFCKKLTEMESNRDRLPFGWEFTLPTGEEWEYACRAGTTTNFFWGDEENQSFVNYENVFEGQPFEVGSFKPNPWGFHDMHGNMWEWNKGHMTRGGGNFSSSFKKIAGTPGVGQYKKMGFRLCLKRLSDDDKHASSGINLLTPDALEIKDNWVLEDGVMTVRKSKQKGNIWTKEKFGDFLLSFEYKTSQKANSGLFFRADPVDPVQRGFEIQIASPGLYNGNTVVGSLYGAMAPMVEAGKPDGEWNSMELICDGPLIKARLNGKEILDLNIDDWKDAGKNPDGTKNKFKSPLKDLPRSGQVGFQYYGQQIWFRNVIIRSLESEDITDLKTSIEEKFKEAMKKPVGEGIHIVESAANMEMIWCKPGSFMMGDNDKVDLKKNPYSGKKSPSHKVTFTKGFFLGKYEVTQEQFEKVMRKNPSEFKDDQHPVEKVTWKDAVAFCEILTANEKKVGWKFSLPTEAQWEYACRAGTNTKYSWGDTIIPEMANYGASGLKKTMLVGSYRSNAWGFFDMHGNVYEWCADWFKNYPAGPRTDPKGPRSGSLKAIRGGAWRRIGYSAMSAHREYRKPEQYRFNDLGFRVCLMQVKEEVKQASIIIKDEENKCFIESFSIKFNENNFSDEGINLKIKHKNEDVWKSNCSPGEITEMLVQTDGNFDQNESIFLYLESENFASQWHRLEKIGKKLIFKDGKNIVLYRKRYAILEYEFYKGTNTNFRGREPNFKGVEILGHWESLSGFGRDWQVWQGSQVGGLWGKSIQLKHHRISRGNGFFKSAKIDFEEMLEAPKKGYSTKTIQAEKGSSYYNYVAANRIEDSGYGKIHVRDIVYEPPSAKELSITGDGNLSEKVDANESVIKIESNSNLLNSREPVRIFKSVQGTSFEGRVLSYEGNNFFLEGKDSKIISVTLNQLSKEDQKYLQETIQAGKIGTGNPLEIASTPVEGKPWTVPSIGLEMIWCEAGTFWMGSGNEKGREKDEAQHKTTLSQGFFLGKYEVKQEEYEEVMGSNPSRFKGDKRPVEQLSWLEVVKFCNQLTENERKAKHLTNDWTYTLPTEAQWEYACRAGSKTAYSWGDSISSKNANSNNSLLNQTRVCGQYEPNKWGFYDMHGNVLEWCLDWYDSSYGLGDFFLFGEDDPTGPPKGTERVCKGGSWYDKGHNLRTASRQSRNPITRLGYLGFRLALKRVDNAKGE